jgi:hypothetical protein
MTKRQAEATGLTRGVDPSIKASCGMDAKDGLLRYVDSYDNDAHTGWLVFSGTTGHLVAIYAYPGVKTPEGIGLGSSYADLHRAYPSWQSYSGDHTNGRGGAPVPGNPKAHYRIVVSEHKVIELSLDGDDQDCYE